MFNQTAAEILASTKLPPFTRALAAALFQTCRTLTKDVRKLCQTGISLAAKITERSYTAEWPVDGCLELKMAEKIGYEFGIFDVYEFAGEKKHEALNRVFWSEKIRNFVPFGGEIELIYLGLGTMEEKELALFETVNCIEIEWDKVEKVREIIGK